MVDVNGEMQVHTMPELVGLGKLSINKELLKSLYRVSPAYARAYANIINFSQHPDNAELADLNSFCIPSSLPSDSTFDATHELILREAKTFAYLDSSDQSKRASRPAVTAFTVEWTTVANFLKQMRVSQLDSNEKVTGSGFVVELRKKTEGEFEPARIFSFDKNNTIRVK